MSANSQPSHLNSESNDVASAKVHFRRMLSQWLETNATFQIRERTLKGWIQEEKSNLAPLLRVLDSILAIPSVILLVLLIWAPPIIIAIILSTRYRRVLSGADSSDLLALLFIGIVFAVVSLMVSIAGIFQCLNYREEKRKSKETWDDWTQLVDPGKRLIVTDKGFLALADDRAMEEDVLFNLVGCPEPVILREVQRRRNRGVEVTRYVIVGKCYAHLAPADQYEYFGPNRGSWNTSQQQEEKEKLLNGTRKWKLEELELV